MSQQIVRSGTSAKFALTEHDLLKSVLVRAEENVDIERARANKVEAALEQAQRRIERLDQANETRLLKLETAIEAQQRLHRLLEKSDDTVQRLTAELAQALKTLTDLKSAHDSDREALEASQETIAAMTAERDLQAAMMRRHMAAFQRLQRGAIPASPVLEAVDQPAPLETEAHVTEARTSFRQIARDVVEGEYRRS
jgi:chromosome segregation ATPase